MRLRDHLALSTVAAGLLAPALGRKTWLPWAASVLIDVDHLAWYSLHTRSLDPVAAMRYFNGARPEQRGRIRALHLPWSLAAIAALGVSSRAARLILLGMLFHVTLDSYHLVRSNRARRATLRRDGGVCQACGACGPDVVAHLWRQPRLLPSYDIGHFVSLCPTCHERAHREGTARVIPNLGATRHTPLKPLTPAGVSHGV